MFKSNRVFAKIKMILCSLLFTAILLGGCKRELTGEAELIEKAREEINLADADTIDLAIIGESVEGESHLVWFMSGNSNQAHSYFPIEFLEVEANTYTFEKEYLAIKRGEDIYVLIWDYGYSFCVNNPKCKEILITDAEGEIQRIAVNEVPFVYYYKGTPSKYIFIDSEGNELR